MDIISFFNSNFFVGFATILTVSGAIIVYFFQKDGYKVQAARVLLTEIRIAEEKVKEINEKIITNTISADLPAVLPTKSWKTYASLFISDFDQDELKLLNSFYDYAELIEEFAGRNNNYFWISTEERAKVTVRSVAEFIKEALNLPSEQDKDVYITTKRNLLSSFLDKYNDLYTPVKTIDGIKVLLSKMPNITTSSCGLKLKKLAKV